MRHVCAAAVPVARARGGVVVRPRRACLSFFFASFCCGFRSNSPQISVYKNRHPHTHTFILPFSLLYGFFLGTWDVSHLRDRNVLHMRS